jgi:hypothetical protein
MVYLTLAETVCRETSPSGLPQWCYVGKDFSLREKVAEVCGENQRYFLENKLHEIVDRGKDAFLEYISTMGVGLPDQLTWWASRLASRSPLQSDFFLLCCYRILIRDLVHHFPPDSSLLIVVEDPWLYCQLQEDLSKPGPREVSFVGKVSLWRHRCRLLARGSLYRLLHLIHLTVQKYVTRFLYGSTTPIKGDRSRSIALLAWIDQRAFNRKSGNFKEIYTGDLASFLESKHIHVICPTYLRYPLRFIGAVAKNKVVLWPLIFDLSLFRALQCALKVWRINALPLPDALGGGPADYLVQREFWHEFSSPSFNENLMYYYALQRFFSRDWAAVFHYSFENQPGEKMMCLAGRDFPGVKMLGYRDSATPVNQLNMFLGKGEKEFVPLPHKIITMGEFSQKLFLEKGRYPEGLMVNGGAWRYVKLATSTDQPTSYGSGKVVLVATPIDKSISRALILDVIRTFQSRNDSPQFLLKCHPAAPFTSLGIQAELGSRFAVTERPVEELLEDIDTIIYSSSTVGVEFFVRGKKVIRYILENQIDLDPLEGVPSHLYYKCYEGACLETIETAVREEFNQTKVEEMAAMRSAFFGPVHPEVWLKEFEGANGRN